MKKVISSVARDLWVVVLDLVAVNLSYYLALLLRFFVGGELRAVAVNRYMPAFLGFAPFYSVLAILVFMAWRLYGGMWRYAGINDMNRIIGASVTTTVLHFLGTLIFFTRMPWTYYVVGSLLQFGMIVIIRFGYRMLLVEKKKMGSKERIPALVVGSGDLGRKVVKHLEDYTPYRAAVIIGNEAGRTMDGVPVKGFEELGPAMEKVQAVFIADKGIDAAQRKKVLELAKDREVNDFTGALSNLSGAVPVSALLGLVKGPVTIRIEGRETRYENGRKALEALKDRYDVEEVEASVITLRKARSFDSAWANQYKEVTGEDISFF